MGALSDAVPGLLVGAARRLQSEAPLTGPERSGLIRLLTLAAQNPASLSEDGDAWERAERGARHDLDLVRHAREALR